jgi:hypothetical protein
MTTLLPAPTKPNPRNHHHHPSTSPPLPHYHNPTAARIHLPPCTTPLCPLHPSPHHIASYYDPHSRAPPSTASSLIPGFQHCYQPPHIILADERLRRGQGSKEERQAVDSFRRLHAGIWIFEARRGGDVSVDYGGEGGVVEGGMVRAVREDRGLEGVGGWF